MHARRIVFLVVLVAIAPLAGCALLTHPVEKPTAQVRAVDVGAVSFTGLDGTIDLDVQNPNAFGVPLSHIEWQLSVGDAQAVSGSVQLSETIPARGTAPVRATLHVDPLDALDVGEVLARGVRTYRLAARLHFQTRLGDLAVDVQGEGDLR